MTEPLFIISEEMLKQWRVSCLNVSNPHTNDDTCKKCPHRGKGDRKGCCDFDDEDMEKIFRSRPLSEELKAERERVMDAHGILYGEDAKRFHEEMNNPNPVMTEVSKEFIREAQKMCAFDEKHDAEVAKKERERVLQKVVKILAAHTINSDDFKQDNINDGWVLIGGYEPILEEIESLRGEP